jgi:5,10-methylenetetrahydromethanopterin reductase
MKIGLFVHGTPGEELGSILARFREAESAGFHTIWTGHTFTTDSLTLLALAGRETSSVELATWVIPTYPRHPTAMAQQALTTQAACGNRLLLGIGLSHQVIVERKFGLDYSKPVRHAREYLTALRGLLSGEFTKHKGEEFRIALQLQVPGTKPPPVLLAALGPQMLQLAGRLADGAAIWLGGPNYLETFAIPTLLESAQKAERPTPRIAVGLPVVVTDRCDEMRPRVAAELALSSGLPSYQSVLNREGVKGPEEVSLIGDEETVRAKLEHLETIGVTDFNATLLDLEGDLETRQRTFNFLSEMAKTRA